MDNASQTRRCAIAKVDNGEGSLLLQKHFSDGRGIQLELVMIRAKVRSGMENVRAKGRHIGRPQVGKEDIPAAFPRHYPAYKSKQLNVSELARVCDISRTTVYKYIGLLEG